MDPPRHRKVSNSPRHGTIGDPSYHGTTVKPKLERTIFLYYQQDEFMSPDSRRSTNRSRRRNCPNALEEQYQVSLNVERY